MHNQLSECAFAEVFFGFVYTAIAGLLSDKMQSNEESKHFTGRIKESQSFTQHSEDMKSNSVSATLVFYICLLFFSVNFLLIFFFFLLLKFSKL